MTVSQDEPIRRARQYALKHQLTVGETLGFGVHGTIFVTKSQTEPGRSAIKVHEREAPSPSNIAFEE